MDELIFQSAFRMPGSGPGPRDFPLITDLDLFIGSVVSLH